MSWQVYGFMHPGDCPRHQQLGPLPRKRWVRQPGERYKPARMLPIGHGDATADEYNERRSITYARWLAARDGITIPSIKVKAAWSGVYSKHLTVTTGHNRRKQARYLRRIRAVQWGHDEDIYNTRKDGRRGAFLYRQFVADLTIEIPNWDFEHPPIDDHAYADSPQGVAVQEMQLRYA